jgi:aryl-alcohol dehydrogenase-like predicted oxidoreductase
LTLAEDACAELGNVTHSFTTIELPINLLETDGLRCASWAKENGLRVLVNRPLNAQLDTQMYRLAEYDESREYYNHFNELLDVCDNDKLRTMFNLLEELDDNKHKFGWIGDYDNFLYASILPHMKKNIDFLDKKKQETLLSYIDMFLIEFRKMVAYECSKKTKLSLKDTFFQCNGSMQECALKFLINSENIDYVLVGMRKPSYVAEVMSFLDEGEKVS